VKQAKAEAKSAELLQQETALQLEAKLQGDYNEAVKLQKALSFYDYSLMGRTLQYLRQSLNEGQISLLTYFTEATPIVQEQMNYVDLECRYQQALARLYKHRL
jgi:outer membrane protein TolC